MHLMRRRGAHHDEAIGRVDCGVLLESRPILCCAVITCGAESDWYRVEATMPRVVGCACTLWWRSSSRLNSLHALVYCISIDKLVELGREVDGALALTDIVTGLHISTVLSGDCSVFEHSSTPHISNLVVPIWFMLGSIGLAGQHRFETEPVPDAVNRDRTRKRDAEEPGVDTTLRWKWKAPRGSGAPCGIVHHTMFVFGVSENVVAAGKERELRLRAARRKSGDARGCCLSLPCVAWPAVGCSKSFTQKTAAVQSVSTHRHSRKGIH